MAASSLYRDIPAPAEDVDRAHGKLTLAWCLHEVHPDARILLAVPFGANERLNILATIGDQVVAIELKYPTRRGLLGIDGERFDLKGFRRAATETLQYLARGPAP
jgi:hypothetical protein